MIAGYASGIHPALPQVTDALVVTTGGTEPRRSGGELRI